MVTPQPQSFLDVIAAGLIAVTTLLVGVSFLPVVRAHATRLLAILGVVALALFANSGWTYFAAVFIIATAITELEVLQNLAAIVRGDKNWFEYRRAVKGEVSKVPQLSSARSTMEYRILNTLWTKQVSKYPDRSTWFTFTIGTNQPGYAEFRQAGYKLMGEGLVNETDARQFVLTPAGFEYCKKHFREFPAGQWWPDEPIDQSNLERVLASGG